MCMHNASTREGSLAEAKERTQTLEGIKSSTQNTHHVLKELVLLQYSVMRKKSKTAMYRTENCT